MKLQRFEVPGLSHYSYVIACGGQAAIVDPKRVDPRCCQIVQRRRCHHPFR